MHHPDFEETFFDQQKLIVLCQLQETGYFLGEFNHSLYGGSEGGCEVLPHYDLLLLETVRGSVRTVCLEIIQALKCIKKKNKKNCSFSKETSLLSSVAF